MSIKSESDKRNPSPITPLEGVALSLSKSGKPQLSFEIEREIRYVDKPVDLRFKLTIEYNEPDAIVALDLLNSRYFDIRFNTLRARLVITQGDGLHQLTLKCNSEGRFEDANLNMPEGLEISPVYHFDLYFDSRPVSTPSTAPTLVDDLNPMKKLHEEIQLKPDKFGPETGRFTLIANGTRNGNAPTTGAKAVHKLKRWINCKLSLPILDRAKGDKPKQFHVHCSIMQLYSVELKRFIDGNLDEIRDGHPLRVACSSLALECLIELIYLQRINRQFDQVVHEVVKVAHLWKMDQIVDICRCHMNDWLKYQNSSFLLASANYCNLRKNFRTCSGNFDGLREGNPLRFRCSSVALGSLLNLIYLQEIDDDFNIVLHEIVDVAHMWKMDQILEICLRRMLDQHKHIKNFEILLPWFVSAHKCDLGIEQEILKSLFVIVKKKKMFLEPLRLQLIEYSKTLTAEESTQMMLKLKKL